jgi:F-type H+-transporting ATPase subunit delta
MAERGTHVFREVYCEVLFELSEQMGQIDSVLGDMGNVSEVLKKEPDFSAIMNSRTIKGYEKAEIVRRVFGGKVSELTLNFLIVLARRDRMGLLTGITNRYETLVDFHKGRVLIEATVARPMDEQSKSKLIEQLKQSLESEVKLTLNVDPRIIGGIVLRRGEEVVDNSVKRSLEKAVKNITEKV